MTLYYYYYDKSSKIIYYSGVLSERSDIIFLGESKNKNKGMAVQFLMRDIPNATGYRLRALT